MNDINIETELERNREEINRLKHESSVLRKAIWDILNYCNMYVLLLDNKLNIKLMNWSLATKLGFQDEKEAIGRCWLDFIPDDLKKHIQMIHHIIAYTDEKDKYREVTNDIKCLNGDIITVRWFNVNINSSFNMTLSAGLLLEKNKDDSIESVRSYYRDIIQKDRTLIKSLRDIVIKDTNFDNVCTFDED